MTTAHVPTCGLCPAFLFDPDSLALRRCFGCRSGPPAMRVEPPPSRFNWVRDPVLDNWLSAYVQIGGADRRVSLSMSLYQREYWHFYRGDGNSGLIAGPTDERGAREFAERWLLAHGAIAS
jgi:hypothetical protein